MGLTYLFAIVFHASALLAGSYSFALSLPKIPAVTKNAPAANADATGVSERDAIDWKSRRTLTWSDFKGSPLQSSPNAALTSTSILISYGYDESELTYQLKCVFYPHKSWTKVDKTYILQHEQGHFDISQLFTRRLHKALSEYKFNRGTVEKDIQVIYQRITQDQASFQQLYDKETNHSRHREKQLEWQVKIESLLNETKAFANYPQ